MQFFKSLLYSQESNKGYTFSSIEKNHDALLRSLSVNSSLGFEYISAETGWNTYPVAFVITHVYKGTDAEKKGLKRGEIILSVNENKITEKNYLSAFDYGDTYDLHIQSYHRWREYDVSVSRTLAFDENPILLDSIYTVDNHKIGYLVYNSFTPKDLTTRIYDVQLLSKLQRFKSEGVTDLILDFRYNGGGYITSAQALASALVPKLNTNDLFEIMTYNSVKQAELDKLPNSSPVKQAYMYDYFTDGLYNNENKKLMDVPTLGAQLNSLYIVGTQFTASASELIINSLRPYYHEVGKTLKIIGENTLGKNVGAIAFYVEDERNPYLIWPISFKIHNKNMDSYYSNGFNPDILVNEFTNLTKYGVGLKNLGDVEEDILAAAINDITGKNSIKDPVARSANSSALKVIGSSSESKPLNQTMLRVVKPSSIR